MFKLCPIEDHEKVSALASRTLWFRFVWNDHNFGSIFSMIKDEVKELGITSRNDADALMESTTGGCQTVEIVDVGTLEYPEHLDGNPKETQAVNDYLYHLTQKRAA